MPAFLVTYYEILCFIAPEGYSLASPTPNSSLPLSEAAELLCYRFEETYKNLIKIISPGGL